LISKKSNGLVVLVLLSITHSIKNPIIYRGVKTASTVTRDIFKNRLKNAFFLHPTTEKLLIDTLSRKT